MVFFYFSGFVMTAAGLALGIAETVLRIMGNNITPATVVLVALLLIAGSQFTLFGVRFEHGVEQGPAANPAELGARADPPRCRPPSHRRGRVSRLPSLRLPCWLTATG